MDTPIVIIIFAYIASFSFLGVQSILGDPIGVDMKAFDDQTGGFTGTDLSSEKFRLSVLDSYNEVISEKFILPV